MILLLTGEPIWGNLDFKASLAIQMIWTKLNCL